MIVVRRVRWGYGGSAGHPDLMDGHAVGTMRHHLQDIERELMLITRHDLADVRHRHGLEPLHRSAYLLLSRMEAEGPLSIGQLAAAFALDTSTVNRQTAAMLRSGLAERIPDPEGGLARKLRITEEGARRLAAHRAWAQEGIGRIVEDWTEEEIGQLLESLTRFNTSIERLQANPWPRPERHAPR